MFELLLKHSPWAWQAGTFAFASGWPLWPLAALVAVAAAFVAWSLSRRRLLSWPRALLIGILQTLFFAIVLLLLWRPVLQVERVRDQENVVAVVLDASASMAYGEAEQSRLQEAVQALQDGPLDALGKTFVVRLFSFADRTTPLSDLAAIPPPGPQSRIGDALHDVLQTASSVPLAGIVLLSDGAENGASLSEQRLAELAGFGVPVHTVGLGPEATTHDLELDSVNMAATASPGEVLTAQVSIRHDAAAKTRLRVYDGGQLLAARDVQLLAEAAVTTLAVEVPAGDAGVRDLRFTLDPLDGERNVTNNTRTHVVDVPAGRRSVLYIEGEPRWEYKFVRRAAETDSSLRLASVVRATPNRYYRQGVQSAEELSNGFPADARELFAYDAVMIGSLEAAALNADQHRLLREFVDRRGGSLMMLAGRDGMADGGWGRVPVAAALPAHLVSGAGPGYAPAVFRAALTVYGAESAIGRLDEDPARNAAAWDGLPPLADFQPLGRLKPGAVVLLNAVNASDTQPLLVQQRFGRGSTYLFSTASTWRWQMRLPSGDKRHQTFWRQLLHALASSAPPRLTLVSEHKVYDDERRVLLTAELRDESFQPVDGAEVSVTMAAERGEARSQSLQPAGEGRYSAIVDAESEGLYRVEMSATRKGDDIGTAATHLRRNDGVVEHFGTYQHRALLERVAQLTGGRYWRVADIGGLPEAIRYSRAGVLERQTLDLWNLPAAFLVLLLLKASEWLLRWQWRTL